MSLLLAVKSCERDSQRGCHKAIRDTWGLERSVMGLDLKFFIGHSQVRLLPDEVALPCSDDYRSLPHKTQLIAAYAMGRYDYLFSCDTDTYVNVSALLDSGFETYDYMGLFSSPDAIGKPNASDGRYWSWCSGGSGYFLSKKAMALIVKHSSGGEWAEDRMVGQILGPYIATGSLKAKHDERFAGTRLNLGKSAEEWRGLITSHFCTQGLKRQYDPAWMLKVHREATTLMPDASCDRCHAVLPLNAPWETIRNKKICPYCSRELEAWLHP